MKKFIFVLLAMSASAFATDYGKKDDGQQQDQVQAQHQDQGQEQQQAQQVTASGAGTATNDGNNTEINSRTENNSSNVVLVPNNNTENCLRVIGIAWGKSGESGALGWPFRSKKCDFEGSADDAFAAGERDLGWFWKCQNPNLYKQFKDSLDPKQACLDRMMKGVSQARVIRELTETLTEIRTDTATERESMLREHRETRERLTAACAESKDRILESCRGK